MKCRKLYPEKRMCGQSDCIEIAKCLTRISGFDVLACKKHHACDHADKPQKGSEEVVEIKRKLPPSSSDIDFDVDNAYIYHESKVGVGL